jgi:hypothetical protein
MTDGQSRYAGDARVNWAGDGWPPDVPALLNPDRIPDDGAHIVQQMRGGGWTTKLAVHDVDNDGDRSARFDTMDEAIADRFEGGRGRG